MGGLGIGPGKTINSSVIFGVISVWNFVFVFAFIPQPAEYGAEDLV